MDCKGASFAWCAFNGKSTAMSLDNMLYDGKPKSSASEFTASGLVNPVKSFKKSGQVFFGDSDAMVFNADYYLSSFKNTQHIQRFLFRFSKSFM